MMNKLKETERKSNSTLHTALCFGLMAVIAVMYYFISSGTSEAIYDYKSIAFIISAVAVLLTILLSSKIYTTNINKAMITDFVSYDDASANFRAANVARWSLIMVVSLLATNVGFYTQNLLCLIPAVVGLLYLFVSKMNEEHFGYYKY